MIHCMIISLLWSIVWSFPYYDLLYDHFPTMIHCIIISLLWSIVWFPHYDPLYDHLSTDPLYDYFPTMIHCMIISLLWSIVWFPHYDPLYDHLPTDPLYDYFPTMIHCIIISLLWSIVLWSFPNYHPCMIISLLWPIVLWSFPHYDPLYDHFLCCNHGNPLLVNIYLFLTCNSSAVRCELKQCICFQFYLIKTKNLTLKHEAIFNFAADCMSASFVCWYYSYKTCIDRKLDRGTVLTFHTDTSTISSVSPTPSQLYLCLNVHEYRAHVWRLGGQGSSRMYDLMSRGLVGRARSECTWIQSSCLEAGWAGLVQNVWAHV